MNNIKKLVSAALISVFAVSTVGCNMITKTDAAIKKSVVAKVNKDSITRGQLDERLAPVISQMKLQGIEATSEQGKELLSQYKAQTLDNMIMEVLFKQKIKENNIITEAKLDEEVKKSYEEIKKTYADEKEFNDKMKEAGLTQEMLMTLLKSEQIKISIYDYVTKDVKVEDKDIQDYYTQNPYEFTEKPNTIHVAHILTDTEEEGKKAKAELDKGAAFDAVSTKYSKDEAAKAKGGDLGEQPYVGSSFDKQFMQYALAMKPGEISAPLQTQFGFHIIKVIEKKEYAIKKLDEVKEVIKEKLLKTKKDEAYTKIIDEWREKAKIETKKYEKNLQ